MSTDKTRAPSLANKAARGRPVLEHIGVYNKMLEYGDRARGKVITVINR
jgi:hypothetical protein